MIPQTEFDEHAARLGVLRQVVEQDYALAWILWCLGKHPPFADAVAFKGGTALKKVFFGEYRFSEDLDFGMRRALLKPPMLRSAVKALLKPLAEACGIQARQLSFKKTNDDYGFEVFRVMLGYDWPGVTPRTPSPRVKLDIHYRGGVAEDPVRRRVIHPYSDAEAFGTIKIPTCTLEEIVAEKLCALVLQGRIGTPRPRDYYDVDRILASPPETIDSGRLSDLFRKKLRFPKEVEFTGLGDLFPERHIERCRTIWAARVQAVSGSTDSLDTVLDRLKEAIPRLLKM